MGRPYQGRHRRCDHPGCKVSISLKEQPRRFALGLCRSHEFDHPRDRIADRPDVRSAVVMGEASNSTGAGAVGMSLSHYAQIIVRSSVPTEWERKFCASVIAQERKGKPLSWRQEQVLARIVRKFQDATMRDDGVTE